MDNRFDTHKNYLPFSAPRGFSCGSILYFKTLTLPNALWLAGSPLWSVGPWLCACNRTKYAHRDDVKLPSGLPRCRDGHSVDTMQTTRYIHTPWGWSVLNPCTFHALYNYKQRGKHILLLSHKNLSHHLVLCRVSR